MTRRFVLTALTGLLCASPAVADDHCADLRAFAYSVALDHQRGVSYSILREQADTTDKMVILGLRHRMTLYRTDKYQKRAAKVFSHASTGFCRSEND